MKKYLVSLLLIILVSGWTSMLANQAQDSIMEETWRTFRQIHPYGFQTVALKHYGDTCVFVVSEPAERVTKKMLSDLFQKYGGTIVIKHQPLGYDGWLGDAVGHIVFADKASFDTFTKDLFTLLYDTDYKAYYTDLDNPVPHTYFSRQRLNYSISAAELTQWFITDKEPFVCGNGTKTISELLKTPLKMSNALYYSKEHGFIAWVIEVDSITNSDTSFALNARKFAMDADLIIGAFGQKGKKIAIIARERIVPVEVLPPLRRETIIQLATTDNDELSQSFERHNIFAGKNNKGQDMAPILLSDELWHTEYGNLLNNTDQMLKSWSENGMILYKNFDYPMPIDWAFNDGALKDITEHSSGSSLTYNWNTAGAGYIIQDINQLDVYAINRTGSLPVSYIPDGMEGKVNETVNDAEELAYDFFSELNSTDLVREVQYATLYQIFRYFRNEKRDEELLYIPLLGLPKVMPSMDVFLKRPMKPDFHTYDSIVENLLHLIRDRQSAAFTERYNQGLARFYARYKSIDASTRAKQLIANDPYGSFQNVLNNVFGVDKTYQLLYEDYTINFSQLLYDYYLYSALDTVEAYIQQHEKVYGSFPYSDVAKYLVCKQADNTYTLADKIMVRQLKTIYREHDEKVDDYNKRVKEGKAKFMEYHFVTEELNHMKQQAKELELKRKDNLDEYTSLIPSLTVEKAIGTLNWLLTDPEEYDAPIGEFYASKFHSSKRWLKSASIACSSNGEGGYGGHNLNAAVSPIKVAKSGEVAKGFCKIKQAGSGPKTIIVNNADKARVTPDVLRAIERKGLTKDFALPKAPTVRSKTILTGQEAKQTLVNGEPIESISALREQIATEIVQKGSSSVKEVHFRDFTAREVHVFADDLRETIVERLPEESINLKNFDINEDIQVITQNDGTVKLLLEQRPETLPMGGNLKAATLEISVPENAARSLKEAILNVFKKSEKQINNRFKWKRELRRELQQTHPEIDTYDIKDELNHIYGHNLKQKEYEHLFQLAA